MWEYLEYVRNRSAAALAAVYPIPLGGYWFFVFLCNFFTDAVNSRFTDRNDHAMLVIEIIMKRENAYFTHIAGYMPE
jgi:hypothetical protein